MSRHRNKELDRLWRLYFALQEKLKDTNQREEHKMAQLMQLQSKRLYLENEQVRLHNEIQECRDRAKGVRL